MPSIPPFIALGLVIASIYAGLFNLWKKGSPRDLLFYLAAAWVGFGAGQLGGWLLHLRWGMIGNIHLIEGTVLSWLLMGIMSWLRMPHRPSH